MFECSDHARILIWLYTWSSYMFDRLLKMHGFWISQGSENGRVVYAEFQICSIMASYASIMPKFTSCLSVPKYVWTLRNIAECSWQCLNKLFWLNMSWYSCNNIFIITNAIILEFLSAQFVHPGTLLPFYIF